MTPTEYTNKPPVPINIIGDETAQMFDDKTSPFKSVGTEMGDNPAFKFISAAMVVHAFNKAALLENDVTGSWDIVQKMDDIISNMCTHKSVSVGHKKHLSALPPLFIHCWDLLTETFPSVVTVTSDGSPDLSKMLRDGYEFLSTCEQRKVGKKSKSGEKRKQPQNTPQLLNSQKKQNKWEESPWALQVSEIRTVR